MPESLSGQAERLYDVFAELVRAYQFRDREGTCCHGLSVSQCYALEALVTEGPVSMGVLARRLYVEVSTMTRIVDRLVADGLVARCVDPKDRRVCCVKATRKGRALIERIRGELIEEHARVLREIPPGSRDAVIAAMTHLLTAFKRRQDRREQAA